MTIKNKQQAAVAGFLAQMQAAAQQLHQRAQDIMPKDEEALEDVVHEIAEGFAHEMHRTDDGLDAAREYSVQQVVKALESYKQAHPGVYRLKHLQGTEEVDMDVLDRELGRVQTPLHLESVVLAALKNYSMNNPKESEDMKRMHLASIIYKGQTGQDLPSYNELFAEGERMAKRLAHDGADLDLLDQEFGMITEPHHLQQVVQKAVDSYYQNNSSQSHFIVDQTVGHILFNTHPRKNFQYDDRDEVTGPGEHEML